MSDAAHHKTQDKEIPGKVVDKPPVPPDGQRQMSKFDQFLLDRQAEGGDPERDPYEGIIAQVLSAETPDAVLTPIEALQGRDVLGVPLLLVGFELNQSEFDAGSPFYASMAVIRSDTQEPTVVNCGHKKVLAQLVKLDEFHNDAA